jgi:toxin FitB
VSARLQYLLDTNVLSETRKKEAEQGVISFLSGVEPSALYFSVLSLGELRKGVALKKKSDPDAAKKIAAWVDGLELSFGDRVLGINAATARVWGELFEC